MAVFLEDDLKDFVAEPSETRGKVPVAEIFPAFQGEGMLVGQPTIFLRLGGCNDRCVWCDSKYAVLPKFSKRWVRMAPTDVVRGLRAAHAGIRHVTLTGGNPAIHKGFSDHLTYIQQRGYEVAIETQGNIYPEWAKDLDQVTLSPKPPSSGNPTNVDAPDFKQWVADRELSVFRMISEDDPSKFKMTDDEMYDRLCIKIVVFDRADYEYAQMVHARFPYVPLFLQTGTPQVIPEPLNAILTGTRQIEDWVASDTRINLSVVRIVPQMHVLLHGTKRGV